MINEEFKRYSVRLYGTVQGVGFRPYTYNTAIIYNIKGWVSNKGSSLVMDIEGEKSCIKKFLMQIVNSPPKNASIQIVKAKRKELISYDNFIIRKSTKDKNDIKFIPYDTSVCKDCLDEIIHKKNSRFGYAFTNCTVCGPRYSIMKSMPYDRKNTTMDSFIMCESCYNEYNEHENRRFHAQTNCCSLCGPDLKLVDNNRTVVNCGDIIFKVAELLKKGYIVAIKGIGGFHLACDAENEETVNTLRKRKNRMDKPFAIMVKNIDFTRKLCHTTAEEEELLQSNRSPIVLLNKKEKILPDNIAPNLNYLGIILPYTPLHYLIFEKSPPYLVMTSGNISSTPIQYKNESAFEGLNKIADYFLIHDRMIYTPVEDSVVKVLKGQESVIRRGRGYSPYTFFINSANDILALGAESKNTFCMSQNGYCYMSQYLGDLKDYRAFRVYKNAIENMKKLLDLNPQIYAGDLNKNYFNTLLDSTIKDKLFTVQHHHAHMVSCMAEHRLKNKVIGVIFDGTGLGTDGNIWGGEFLIGDRKGFTRVGHLRNVTIQGRDCAVKEPWRIAVSYLYSIGENPSDYLKDINESNIRIILNLLKKNMNCFVTSSMGRLFDCIASLLKLRYFVSYDGQGAVELENIVDKNVYDCYNYSVEDHNGNYIMDYEVLLEGVLYDIKHNIEMNVISSKFHKTVGMATVETVNRIKQRFNISEVVLSGGVFENKYLLSFVYERLKEKEFKVYYNKQIPINDGGISAGQLVVADTCGGDNNVYCSSW